MQQARIRKCICIENLSLVFRLKKRSGVGGRGRCGVVGLLILYILYSRVHTIG